MSGLPVIYKAYFVRSRAFRELYQSLPPTVERAASEPVEPKLKSYAAKTFGSSIGTKSQ